MGWIKLIFPALFLSLFFSTAYAQNTPEADYQHQLNQYLRYYAEFQTYRSDYLANNTLDNEQKGVLAAKAALNARELALMSLARSLKQSILSSQIDHPLISSSNASLDTLINNYLADVEQVKTLQTKKDLMAYTLSVSERKGDNQDIIYQAEIANKLGKLLRLNEEIKTRTEEVKSKLQPQMELALVENGFEEIDQNQQYISSEINSIISYINQIPTGEGTREELMPTAARHLSNIRAYQLQIVDRLIDFDKNYVNRKD